MSRAAICISDHRVHGSAVAFGGRGLLILGRSGSGKSSLAADMLALGADLVADDQVLLISGHRVRLSAPETLAGKIEIRHLGILTVPYVSQTDLYATIHLDMTEDARLPKPETANILGSDIPFLRGGGLRNLATACILLLKSGVQVDV